MQEEKSGSWLRLVDEETGLYNRLLLVHHLNESHARARRHQIPLSCVLLQVNWWREPKKDIPEYGDSSSVIRELAHFLGRHVRAGDILGRWGYREILLVTHFTPPEAARQAVKKIAKNLVNCEFCDLPGLTVSIRAGISGIPDDASRIRYAEDFPLIAHDKLEYIFQTACLAKEEYSLPG